VDVGGFVTRLPRDNVQCKFIAGAVYAEPCTAEICERAKENLVRYFSVAGLLERFEESLALMKLRFGWTLKNYSSFNVTRTRPNKRDLPTSTLDLIAERNSFDIALYRCAAKLFQNAVTKNAGEVSRIVCETRSGANPGPLELRAFFNLFGRQESDQQSLFGVVACCQVHWLALSADEQDFGAVRLKDNLGVFMQIYTRFWTVPSKIYAN
jgi:hypothetical protein